MATYNTLKEQIRYAILDINFIRDRISEHGQTNQISKHLINSAIIRASGCIEQIIKTIIIDFLSRECNTEARYYFSENLFKRGLNCHYDTILKNLTNFSNTHANLFKHKVKNPDMEKLNSLIKTRNIVSHGGVHTTSIKEIRSQFASAIKIIHIIYGILK